MTDRAESRSRPASVRVGVTMLLADAAQVADGKLYVLGGGLAAVGPRAQPVAVALLISVPWDAANVTHEWVLELLDDDGHAVPDDEHPVVIGGRFEAGRPAGTPAGAHIVVPLAINFPTLPVQPGHRYLWQLQINGASRAEWRLPLLVR